MDACHLAMERGLDTIDYNDNQSNLRVSWQQVHQSSHTLMSHQNSKGGKASVYPYGKLTTDHHNKPEEHDEKKEKFDEDISLEEALSTL